MAQDSAPDALAIALTIGVDAPQPAKFLEPESISFAED
jgi:hypothetical protein